MAIRVGYFENTDKCYAEGPFVMVNAGGWRVEAGDVGMKCPTLLSTSVYRFIEHNKFHKGKFDNEDECAALVDFLNSKVRAGFIVKDEHGAWVVA